MRRLSARRSQSDRSNKRKKGRKINISCVKKLHVGTTNRARFRRVRAGLGGDAQERVHDLRRDPVTTLIERYVGRANFLDYGK